MCLLKSVMGMDGKDESNQTTFASEKSDLLAVAKVSLLHPRVLRPEVGNT